MRKTLGQMTPKELIEGIIKLERLVYEYGTLNRVRELKDFDPSQWSKKALINEYAEIADYCQDRFGN